MESYDLIILVIASHNSLYDYFRAIWNKYDKSCPTIKVFYVYGSSSNSLKKDITDIKENTKIPENSKDLSKEEDIFSDTPECLKPGVLIKTLDALAYIDEHYDYKLLLRTNLSSFFIFERLSSYIKGLPLISLYEGVHVKRKSGTYCSGAGFFLSRDLVKLLLVNRTEVIKEANEFSDDRLIGGFLRLHGITVRRNRHRYDICNHRDEKNVDEILQRIKNKPWFYHIRFKCGYEKDRDRVDSYGMFNALRLFYSP